MSITVELTYDMSKELGVPRFEVATAATVADVLHATRERFGASASRFETLSKTCALAVNGVLSNHRKGLKTKLEDGDRVSFVKASAGG